MAQGDGVTYDPGSPAGKEYQLPLNAARGTGGGGGGSSVSQTGSGPSAAAGSRAAAGASGVLFGAGIAPAAGTRANSTSSDASGGTARTGKAAVRAKARRQSARAVTRERKNFEQAVAASPGASPLMIGGLTAAAALVLALAAAFASRRWRA